MFLLNFLSFSQIFSRHGIEVIVALFSLRMNLLHFGQRELS